MLFEKVYGFVVSERAKSVLIREANGVQHELTLAQIESRTMQKQSMMPDGVVSNLTPEELADLIAYLVSDRATYMTGSIIAIDGGELLTAGTELAR